MAPTTRKRGKDVTIIDLLEPGTEKRSRNTEIQVISQIKKELNEPAKLLADVFCDVDVSNFPADVSPNAPPDAWANYVLENPDDFAKKPDPRQRELPQDSLEPILVSLVDGKRPRTGKLIEAFYDDFKAHFESNCLTAKRNISYDKQTTSQLLHQHFPHCRTLLISHLVDEFSGRYSTAAWVCFFAESKAPYMVRNYFHHIEETEWTTMTTTLFDARKRRRNWIEVPADGTVADSVREFRGQLDELRREYPLLFDGERLKEGASQVEVEERKFDCVVCYESFPVYSAISCCPPTNVLNGDEVIDLLAERPSTSRQMNAATSLKHSFCVDCVVGQARAATTEMPLAEGGIGLRCMATDCSNPILFCEYRSFIPPDIRKLLNERIVEENLGASQLPNLERCHQCNFAIEMDVPKEVQKVFSCLKCHFEYCRICERPWDDKHFGVPCEELEQALSEQERKTRKFQEKLSEAIIRKCHRCSLAFVKKDQCNKMTCRCGATQCYLCRKPDIKYTHFCQHYRTPGQKGGCKQCGKKQKCLLWAAAGPLNKKALEEVRSEAAREGVDIEA